MLNSKSYWIYKNHYWKPDEILLKVLNFITNNNPYLKCLLPHNDSRKAKKKIQIQNEQSNSCSCSLFCMFDSHLKKKKQEGKSPKLDDLFRRAVLFFLVQKCPQYFSFDPHVPCCYTALSKLFSIYTHSNFISNIENVMYFGNAEAGEKIYCGDWKKVKRKIDEKFRAVPKQF